MPEYELPGAMMVAAANGRVRCNGKRANWCGTFEQCKVSETWKLSGGRQFAKTKYRTLRVDIWQERSENHAEAQHASTRHNSAEGSVSATVEAR